MKIPKIVYLVSLVSFFTSFTSCTTYKIIKFNKTPENAAAFRDCQRTFATAVGYDDSNFDNLKIRCLSTLNITTYYYQTDSPQDNIDGCEKIESAWIANRKAIYYMCPIESK